MSHNMYTFKLSEWTMYPGGRRKSSGEYSGEEFADYIIGKLCKSLFKPRIICIDFSGTAGACNSFMDEVIGRVFRDIKYFIIKGNLSKDTEVYFINEDEENFDEFVDQVKSEWEQSPHPNSNFTEKVI